MDKLIFDFQQGKIYRRLPNGLIKLVDTDNGHGYKRITINGKCYKQHRLLFEAYYNTPIPSDRVIDHINQNKSDNRIENLRIVDRKENGQNRGKNVNNKSGHKNVSWYKNAEKWQVLIQIDGVKKHFGLFDNVEDAVVKRDQVIEDLNNKGNKFSV